MIYLSQSRLGYIYSYYAFVIQFSLQVIRQAFVQDVLCMPILSQGGRCSFLVLCCLQTLRHRHRAVYYNRCHRLRHIFQRPILLLQNFGDIIFSCRSQLQVKHGCCFLLHAIRQDFNSLFSCLLSSRADSTVKKYLKEINKFLLWCRTRKIALQLPFSSFVVALYLFGLDQQLRSPAAFRCS